MQCFLANSIIRIFPNKFYENLNFYKIYVAKNETLSYQVCIYNDKTQPIEVEIDIKSNLKSIIKLEELIPAEKHTADTDIKELDGVGQIPTFAPDPLIDTNKVTINPFSTRCFFVKKIVPKNINSKEYKDTVIIKTSEEKQKLECPYFVSDFTIENKKQIKSLYWFYADALCDYYNTKPFSSEFWNICEKYMTDYSEHGNNIIYLPLFTPPLDGIKRPTQLLNVKKIEKDKYEFDFKNVTKWIKLANKCNIFEFECVHLFTQWGCAHPIRIYEDTENENSLLFDPESSATGNEYKIFLQQFLTALKAYTEEMGIYDKIHYHMSDEPHGDDQLANYKLARNMLKEIAPWVKIMDALSDTAFVSEAGVDMPIASIGTANNFLEKNIPHWVYFCCGPRGEYINNFIDTPLWKQRMLGIAMYKLNAIGFLFWGYNYWYKMGTREIIDPYRENCADKYPEIPMGDSFVVYPSAEGPVPSIRWEVYAEALQDFDLLSNLNINKKSELLEEITSYKNFPRDEYFILKLREKLLKNQ